jgi:hypothetical protein
MLGTDSSLSGVQIKRSLGRNRECRIDLRKPAGREEKVIVRAQYQVKDRLAIREWGTRDRLQTAIGTN